MRHLTEYGTAGLVGFGVLTLGNIVSTTMLIWLAAAGRSVLVVFPFCVGAWGCYLCSHYLVEGEFIDRSDSGEQAAAETSSSSPLPSSRLHQVLSVVGVGSMFLTFPTGIVAVSQNDLRLLFVSATLFVVGYIVGHQGLTKKPL